MWSRLKRYWQAKTGNYDTPLDYDLPFWAVSLTFHLCLLVLLARILMPPAPERNLQLTALADEPTPVQVLPPEVQFDPQQYDETGSNSLDSNALAASQAPVIEMAEVNPVEASMSESLVGDLMLSEEFEQATADRMESMAAKGTVGQAVAGAAGAIDRITQEILLSLDERKTTVIWLFDQSASLMQQREEIKERFERVYGELTLISQRGDEVFKKHGDQPLLTQVYAFGSTFNRMLTEPTSDVEQLTDAIEAISRDDTGLEYVFSAVLQTATDFQKLRKVNRSTGERERNVMIIVVSDEAGDDINRLDECTALCNKWEIPVYVVGVPAPFGREETQVRWVDPDPMYDQSPQWAVVSQGPETVMSERLNLDYAGGDFSDLELLDSGFGPFGLTRLCYETGGIFFAVHPNREVGRTIRRNETAAYSAYLQHFFDPEVMKRYKPDYVSRQTYLDRLASNRCRQSLVQAAQFSQIGTLQAPGLVFPKLDEAAFVNTVSQAQRAAAILEPKMNQLYEILRQGEANRDDEISPRWQAGFDLAYGRVLAGKVRAESYNAMLALIKTKLKFQDEKNNTWVLKPADSIDVGSQAESMAQKAKTYLHRVINEHPDTPWAMLAKRELETPVGWKWGEQFTPPPPPPREMTAQNNNNVRPNVPQPQPLEMPKVKRPPPKL